MSQRSDVLFKYSRKTRMPIRVGTKGSYLFWTQDNLPRGFVSLDLKSLTPLCLFLWLHLLFGQLSEVYHKDWRKVSLIVSFSLNPNIFLLLPSALAEIDGGASNSSGKGVSEGPVAVTVLEAIEGPRKGPQEMHHAEIVYWVNSFL